MDFPLKYKQLWSKWDVRVLILVSLFIQIILIFLGRMRKSFNSRWIRMILWCCYLLADSVASFVLGQLSGAMDDSSSSNAIIAFWAPFLILHLGGPDTITAYSMEDNELWARHLLGLGYELSIAFYVIFRSLPNTRLLAPTLLIFLVAIIKYLERTYSLYKASIEGFRVFHMLSKTSPSIEYSNILSQAFWLYHTYKPSFIGDFPRYDNYQRTRDFINNMTSKEILKVTSMELSFAYDEFYTKAIVSHSRSGYILRVLCSICISLTFSLFFIAPKDDFKNVDVAITYVLLIASICLDLVATVMLVFSDRMLVSLLNVKKNYKWSEWVVERIVIIKKAFHKRKYMLIKMPQLSLLSIIIRSFNKFPRPSILNRLAEKLCIVQVIMLYMPSALPTLKWAYNMQNFEQVQAIYKWTYNMPKMEQVQATYEHMEIIASCLQRRLHLSPRELKKPAGFFAFQRITSIHESAISIFVHLYEGLPLDEQIFVWHITTELCLHQPTIEEEESELGREKRKRLEMEACKYLSRYMMHMVLTQSDMIKSSSKVLEKNFAEIRTKNFIGGNVFDTNWTVENLCKGMTYSSIDWTDDKSLFVKSRVLANFMFAFSKEERWQVMTTIWVELLIKVAKDSQGSSHMKKLSRGDELLTVIWLYCKHVEMDNLTVHGDSIANLGEAKNILSQLVLNKS